MARRTDPVILQQYLAQRDGQRAMPATLASELAWSEQKLDRVVDRAIAEPGLCISRGRRGVIEFTGNEIGHLPNVYRHAYRILAHNWGPKQGYRNIEIYPTAHSGHRGAAEWIHPDAVMTADPRRRSSQNDPPQVHTFEIERAGGFKIQSIFEAFVQGRGADFSWVIFSRDDITTDDYWDRVAWAAQYVDVGLITYDNIGRWSTWSTDLRAGRRKRNRDDTDQFRHNVMGETLPYPV